MKTTLRFLVSLYFLGAAQLGSAHPGADATLEDLSGRITASPDSPELYHRRGVAYSNAGQFDRALEDLHYAATLGDRRAMDFDLGIVHFRMANYNAARASFDSYLNYLPGHIRALRYRARLRDITGDDAGALNDYAEVLAAEDQAMAVDYLAAAKLMVDSPNHGVDAALELLDLGMNRLGPIVPLQRPAIDLEITQGRYDKAIARQQSMPGQATNNPFWHVEMGQLLIASGHFYQALKYLADAEQQLASLRRTPARVALSDELRALLLRLDADLGPFRQRVGNINETAVSDSL